MRNWVSLILPACLSVYVSAWVPCVAGEVLVERGFVRAMPPGAPNTAAFMRLVNTGTEAVVIDGGATEAAERVEIHVHAHSNGMMSMHQVPEITVPGNGEFVLKPGEYHLMLMNLVTPLKEGDTVLLELQSGDSTVVRTQLPVRSVMKEHHH